VLRHYTACNLNAHSHIKIIANSFYVDRMGGHPYNAYFWYVPLAQLNQTCLTLAC
jgi:hypothetical protein